MVIDPALFGIGGDQHGRDSGSRTPAVTLRRGKMIPEAAILIIGEEDGAP